MKRFSRPRFQPLLDPLEDRCTPSAAHPPLGHALPPEVAAHVASPQPDTLAAPEAKSADARVAPFKVNGGGTAPLGLPVFPGGQAPHNATGIASHLGKY